MEPLGKTVGGKVKQLASRKGRKGHLYRQDIVAPGPTPEEELRILKRRIQKAERDERMDITAALTPPKTYMGGFTRPRDLRAGNWFPGGQYVHKGKKYESPHESAYEPHTVFLLESRYKVRHGTGRVDSIDHVVGVCRAVDFVKLVKMYNSNRCPSTARQSLDNACWPWLEKSGKVLKPTRWWDKTEKLEDIMKEIYEDPNYSSKDIEIIASEAEHEGSEEIDPSQLSKQVKKKIILVHNTTNSIADTPPHMNVLPDAKNALETDLVKKYVHDTEAIRQTYWSIIGNEPFWRPLLAVTLSTRPLALSLSRLSKSRERGLPFYAFISNDDRKCLMSFGPRMRNLRLDRIRQLTMDIVSRLAGHFGGFIGIRFDSNTRGRGIDGEGLASPIPPEKRIVHVQIGNWFDRAEEENRLYTEGGKDWGGTDSLRSTMMNEWGRQLDAQGNELPLSEAEMSDEDVKETEDDDVDENKEQEDEEEDDEDVDDDMDQAQADKLDDKTLFRTAFVPGRKKLRLVPDLRGEDEDSATHRRRLAYAWGARHHKVVQVK